MPKGVPRDSSTQHLIYHRLKIAQGHLDKVISLSQQGVYCIDVINQLTAVIEALKKTNQVILSNHLKTCVVDSIKKGEMEEAVGEVIKVMEKSG